MRAAVRENSGGWYTFSMNVRELFDRRRAEAAAQLEEATKKAEAAGKEPFDLATFERLLGRGSQAGCERERRVSYYISNPEIQTMMEFVAFLERIEPWEDSS